MIFICNPFIENKLCNETATLRKYKHNFGFDPFRVQRKPCEKRPLPLDRNLIQVNDWQMAPNRYTIGPNYYDEKKGSTGAYWRKKPTSQRRQVPTKSYGQKFMLPKLNVPLTGPNTPGTLSLGNNYYCL